MNTKTLTVTPLENTILTALVQSLYAEPGFSDVDAKDLSLETGIDTRSIRGALGSLVRKGVVTLEQTNTYGAKEQYVIIYLNPEFWGLHPEWKSENDAVPVAVSIMQ